MDELLTKVVAWAEARADVVGVALVGSHARGTATESSDVDVIIVVESTPPYLGDDDWPRTFGTPTSLVDEDYGLVRSRRVVYREGLEVEWCLADRRWVQVPPDPGTAQVVRAGMRALYDPYEALAALGRAAAG